MRLLRRIGNRLLDLAFIPGTERLWLRRLRGRVMALVYHRVAAADSFPFLTAGGTPAIAPTQLQREIGWLQAQGARFLTFADLRAGRFPAADEFGIVLTFDDGFRDNYVQGLEVLETLRVKAVFFQCSAMVDGEALLPEHALYWYGAREEGRVKLFQLADQAGWPLQGAVEGADLTPLAGQWIREVPALSLQSVLEELRQFFIAEERELARKLYPTARHLHRALSLGHELGSHGDRHLHRATLDDDAFEQELTRSCTRLEEVVGVSPVAFSYPFNGYIPGDEDRCGRHFQQVATVDPGTIDRHSNPLALPRYSWPGQAPNRLRMRRWLLTGRI